MLWLLVLPIRLAFVLLFGLLWLPFMLLGGLLRVIGTIVLLPLVLVMTAIGLLVGGLVFVIPLVVLGLFVWVFVLLLGRPFRATA